ncbi:hypothetical protein KKB14_00880 [Patescibacteria group bacterium]|nr:hypothetical protein [Patescibacteria group bacterium]MBU2416259.1 hypothetical protein [Patescibacteria group bacterium]
MRSKLDVVFISNYRDDTDVTRFGFWDINSAPDVLSWICYEWEGIKGQLLMIGSTTEQIVGEKAIYNNKQKAKQQFVAAVHKAVNKGSKVILLAAATKRLLKQEELQKLFPNVIFTIGDNFTALLLQKRIAEAFELSGLKPNNSRALIIAPHGFLGSAALHFLQSVQCKILGLGKKEKQIGFERYAERHGFQSVYSFEQVIDKVDLVVACSSDPQYMLQSADIENLCNGHKLIVVDPCQPPNITPNVYYNNSHKLIHYDAGNGYSKYLKYIGGAIASRILRLTDRTTFGCFCEAFLIAKHPELKQRNWFVVSPENINAVSKFFGEEQGQFNLPKPTCFGKPIPQQQNEKFIDWSWRKDEI